MDRGKTNEQIWWVLKRKFRIDDRKRHYPQAYRRRYEREKMRHG